MPAIRCRREVITMPVLERNGLSLYYEEYGEGFPLLLFAPGGMNSVIQLWRGRPGAPDDKLPWIDPTVDLAGTFRVIAVDQRNAGRSCAPIGPGDSWATYMADALALLDHLGIEKTHVMGGCIGSAYSLALIQAGPDRVVAAVLQNPIGLTSDNRSAFYTMFDDWAKAIAPEHPEADRATFNAFKQAMFGGEFVFSVSRQFVRESPVPLLVLPGGDHFHPREVALEIAELAPKAEIVDPWAGEDRKPATRDRIRDWLLAHTPA
jgi:pimeloyl-ACP methyl ester carboxylesterase